MESLISNRDIMESDLDELFESVHFADCMYSDPPWGPGALKMFRTINKQRESKVDWGRFMYRFKRICTKRVDGPIFIETGIRSRDDFVYAFGEPEAEYRPLYGSSKIVNVLLVWGARPEKSLDGMHGVELVITALTSIGKTPEVVFDPCVGLGTTAKACKRIGSVCLANELNRDRMFETMEATKIFREV